MDDFLGLIVLIVIAYLILIISVIVKFFQMANDVRDIKNHLFNGSVSVKIKNQKESEYPASETLPTEAERLNNSDNISATSDITDTGITNFKLDDGRRINICTRVSNTPSIGDEVLMDDNSYLNGEVKISFGFKSWILHVSENKITQVLKKRELELSNGLKVNCYSQNDSTVIEGDYFYLKSGEPLPDGEYLLSESFGGEKFVVKDKTVVVENNENRGTLIVIGIVVLIIIVIILVNK